MAYSENMRPDPEEFRMHITPNELDDPLFRAAAAATVYQPDLSRKDENDPDEPPDPEPEVPIPPEIWPGL